MATTITLPPPTLSSTPELQPEPQQVTKPHIGRPCEFTEAFSSAFCERIAGGEAVKSICSDPDMPSMDTVFKWLARFPVFTECYIRARETRAHSRFESIGQTLDDMRTGKIDAQMARVEVDALKWLCGKELPTRYGDLTRMEHSGPGGAAIPSTLTVEFVRPGESASRRIIDVTPTAEVPALPAPVVIEALPAGAMAPEPHSEREIALMAEIARLKAEGDKLRRKALRRARKAKQGDNPVL